MKDRQMSPQHSFHSRAKVGAILSTVLVWSWRVLRLPLSLVLAWLRGPIVFVCKIISGPALVASLCVLVGYPSEHRLIYTLAAVSLFAFLVVRAYDCMLMMLSATNRAPVLY